MVVECRHCGTNVSPGTDECPACGARNFCRYEIPT
ncbi:zinc-ribbon domain-containing protein [Halorientalis marina]